jgi:transglutaminase-like putative cysteine protease
MKALIPLTFFFFLFFVAKAQEGNQFSYDSIPKILLKNANAVIRQNNITIIIDDYDDVEIVTDRIVTILNKKGLSDIKAGESYDDDTKIKEIEVTVYDSEGNKQVRFKRKEFKDVSAVSNGTLYSDNRVKYLEYTPRNYPFTIHFTSKVAHSSTAFLPSWAPLEYFYASTQSSNFKVENKADVEVKFKESHLENYSIQKNGLLNYTASNIPAIVPQAYSPDFITYGPLVKIALKEFSMKGVAGRNNNWKDFGKWMNDALLSDVSVLPQELIEEIKSLTKDATTQKEKAVLVYNFMQDRSRYISVQVGIGGWKPIQADKVHEVAYGDCKGLSNYTKALLKEVGIESHHAILYGDRNIRSLDKDFSSTQGNHMILYVPKLDEEENIWLECTSKTSPFGYIAGWTDDRDALVIKDSGGEIIHTTVYKTEDNLQKSTAQIELKRDGSATARMEMITSGYQYSFREGLNKKSEKDLKKTYPKFWSHLNGIYINEVEVINDKELVEVRESVSLSVEKYASKTGGIFLFQPVFFNRNETEPARYKNRYSDFEIDRGYVDIDDYEIILDNGLKIDALPEIVKLDNKFGIYELTVTDLGDNKLKVKRYLKVNKGYFDKEDYELYREFRAEIVKSDNSKAVLKINK